MNENQERITLNDIREGCKQIHKNNQTDARMCTINGEFRQGMDSIQGLGRSVTFFGSARTREGTLWYEKARFLAKRISQELGHTIVTGGGPGIMGAANQGAYEAGGKSVGFTIKLPMEQTTNLFLTEEIPFYYFFTRKVALSFAPDVFIIFPGGYGTMDEIAEVLTLIQTKKMERVPVIMVGKDFWTPLVEFFKNKMVIDYGTISQEDLDLFTLTDDDEEIINIIKNTPKRNEE